MPQVTFSSDDSGKRLQENSQKQLHAVLMFLIAALGGYLQSRNISPFEDHKYIMIAISVTQSVYAFGLLVEFKTQNPIFHSILRKLNPLIGILVVVLLMLILFPLLALAALILWALFMLEASIKTSHEFHQWLCLAILQFKQIIGSYFDNRRREESSLAVGEENGSTTPETGRHGIELLPV